MDVLIHVEMAYFIRLYFFEVMQDSLLETAINKI